MKISSKIAGVLNVLGVIALCLLGSIEFHAFNANYYKSEYLKLHTAESIGMSEEALFEATDALLDYLKGKREDIFCVQNIRGVDREVFDERETAHMVDVKNLYISAKNVGIGMSIIGLISFLWMIYLVRSGKESAFEMRKDLASGFKQVLMSLGIIVAGIVVYAVIDFSRFWVLFHEIFFTNDLWLLDPNVSVMINMFPEEFFNGMVMRIILTFILCFLVMVRLYIFVANKLKFLKSDIEIHK